jgi:hypothetical protein
MHDDILYKQQSNINSIAVSGSSEVQFGHRINYNGPVTITQQIVVRDEEGLKKSNYANGAFKGKTCKLIKVNFIVQIIFILF